MGHGMYDGVESYPNLFLLISFVYFLSGIWIGDRGPSNEQQA